MSGAGSGWIANGWRSSDASIITISSLPSRNTIKGASFRSSRPKKSSFCKKLPLSSSAFALSFKSWSWAKAWWTWSSRCRRKSKWYWSRSTYSTTTPERVCSTGPTISRSFKTDPSRYACFSRRLKYQNTSSWRWWAWWKKASDRSYKKSWSNLAYWHNGSNYNDRCTVYPSFIPTSFCYIL